MGDVGGVQVGVDMSVLDKAFASNFMGVSLQANKILFIIDYSASMNGRDKVMRHELAAIEKLPAVGSVSVIFFSGPTWVAGGGCQGPAQELEWFQRRRLEAQ